MTWSTVRLMVLERDGHRCLCCGEPCPKGEADVHHLVPRALGGEDIPSNLVTLCDGCHAAHHPTLQASLARRMIERWALRLARWLDFRRTMPAQVDHLGTALRLFGKSRFREGQLEVVTAALQGQSVLLVSPTGSGKSLCYQLPAVLQRQPTMVLSPLKALMSDQVVALQLLKIPATFINSSLSRTEKELRFALIEADAVKLVYCAPERFDPALVGQAAVERLSRLRPAFLVVDEAHCIDRWGDAFRPSYGRIAEMRRALGNPPVLAFTATAGASTQRRILESLDVQDAKVVVSDVDRPNIALFRIPQQSDARKIEMIAGLLRIRHGGRVMIFVPTRKAGELVQQKLAEQGHDVPFFHARLDELEKEFLLGRYSGRLQPELRTIICTNAFGMGLDLPDVRVVIHWQTPGSVEDYVQEFGRAGRDGRQSVAVLFGSERDAGLHRFMLQKTLENAAQAGGVAGAPERLQAMARNREQQIDTITRMGVGAERCFRRELRTYFMGEEPPRRRPLHVVVLSWLFGSKRQRQSRGDCCDYCSRSKEAGEVDVLARSQWLLAG